jgi:hypothetical protein
VIFLNLKGREVVAVPGRVAITTHDGETTLTLSNITADDSGKYVVAATNEHASHCHFASLAVEGKFSVQIFHIFQ